MTLTVGIFCTAFFFFYLVARFLSQSPKVSNLDKPSSATSVARDAGQPVSSPGEPHRFVSKIEPQQKGGHEPMDSEDLWALLKQTLVKPLRSAFEFEWTWRTYLCLQGLAIACLVFLEVTQNDEWSAFPRLSGYRAGEWDFLKAHHWNYHRENWVMLACLVSPFLIAKGIDWVSSARHVTSKPPEETR